MTPMIAGKPGAVLKAAWLELLTKLLGQEHSQAYNTLSRNFQTEQRSRAALEMISSSGTTPGKVSYSASNLIRALKSSVITWSTLIRGIKYLGFTKITFSLKVTRPGFGVDSPPIEISVGGEIDLLSLTDEDEK